MNVSLTPKLRKLVNEKVKSGLYQSASEVMREALRLLEERDEVRRLRLEELKRKIAKGIAQADRGEFVDGEEVFRELREKARRIAGANA